MAADDKIMEALARLEHKVDLLFRWLNPSMGAAVKQKPIQLGDPRSVCPVCEQPISYSVDIADSVVVRKCGCSTGKIALDLKAFAPPETPAKRTNNGGRDDEQEDRDDSDRGYRRSQRR
jgi:hypothetical protein